MSHSADHNVLSLWGDKTVLWRYLALFALNFLATSVYWSHFRGVYMEDEAIVMLGARRILEGELPYRDFFTHFTPGSYFVAAAWFAGVGLSGLTARVLFGLISALTGLAIQRASDQVFQGHWRYLPWLLWTSMGFLDFPVLNYHWMGVAAVTCGWALCLSWVTSPEPTRWPPFGCGACLAAALWFLQSDGLALLVSLALVWLRLRPGGLRWIAAGGLVTSLVLWAPLLPYAGVIWKSNVAGLSGHLAFTHVTYSPQRLAQFIQGYGLLNPALGPAIWFGALSHISGYVLRYGLLPWLALAALLGAERRRRPAEQVLAYSWLGWCLVSVTRMQLLYVTFLTPGWALVFTLVLSWLPRAAWWASGLAAFQVLGWLAQARSAQHRYIYPVTTRIGLYWSSSPYATRHAVTLQEWFKDMPPGTHLVAFPYSASIYVLYRLHNPLRRALLPPELVPEEALVEAKQEIERQRVPWLLYLATDAEKISEEYSVPAAQVRANAESLRQRLTQGYQLVQGGPEFGLYRR